MANDPKKKQLKKIQPPVTGYDGSGINPAAGSPLAGRGGLIRTPQQPSPSQRAAASRRDAVNPDAPSTPRAPAGPTTAAAPAEGSEFTPESASVADRLNDILATDSPLMQQAATRGKQAANRRGLLNSTMGVQAAQSSMIDAAVPIASQEAGQVHQTNLQGRDIENRERMQGREFEHETGMQGRDITSRERMQGRDIESREGMLETEIGSRETMQGREIEHQQFMQSLDNETRERIAGLDREAQERISNLQVAASERQAASQLAASFETSYAQIISNIMANPEIPADARQRFMDHAARVRDSNLSLVEQMYSVELDWGSNRPAPRPGAQPGGPSHRDALLRNRILDAFA